MSTPVAPRPLWRDANYLTWLASDTTSALSVAVQSFAVPLLALYITGGPAQAGMVVAVGQVGRLLAVIPGGVLTDRHDRRQLMIIAGLLGAALAGSMAALEAVSLLGLWLLTILNLLLNIRSGLLDAAGNAALKNILAERQLGSAVAANQGRDAAISLGGGPLGGVLMVVSRVAPFAVSAASHCVASMAALLVRGDLRPGRGPARSYVAEAREGLGWILARRDLRGVMVVATVINLGFNAAIMSLVFGLQQHGRSPAVIGLVSASIGVGMLAGSAVAPALVRRVPTGALSIAGFAWAVTAVAILPVAVSLPPAAGLWTMLALMTAASLAIPAINAGILGYFMATVPTSLIGRANSALDLMGMGAIPLAPLVAGLGYAVLGWGGVLAVCAGICAVAAAMAAGNRHLRSIPASGQWVRHGAGYGAGQS